MPRPRLSLALVALLVGLLSPLAGAGTAHADGPTVRLLATHYTGCEQGAPYLMLEFAGTFPDAGLTFTVELQAGGLVYYRESQFISEARGTRDLHPHARWDGVPEELRGSWPIPSQQNVRVDLSLTSSNHVLDSWTTVFDSCQSGVMLFNGPGESDVDRDLVTAFYDRCPEVSAPSTADGCPVVRRTLTLGRGTTALTGRLTAAEAALHQGRGVVLYRVTRGADRELASTVTDRRGRYSFPARLARGDVYATSPEVVEPTIGRGPEASSRTLHLG